MTHDIVYTDEARNTIYPSSQVDSTLPAYINQNYRLFVTFMERANEASERLGFGQNLLQNLQKYRDFDTYHETIVQENELAANLAIDSTDELVLESTYGFPSINGIVLINDEVIYYRERIGNKLTILERGCNAQTVLNTFTQKGVYTESVPAAHLKGATVKNISVLFLTAMAQTISDSFSNNIAYNKISDDIDKSILLQNLKDFYQSKGTKLGIKALFKMFFSENDVDVTYPGDRMIIPSRSGYIERQILRTIPVSKYFYPSLQKDALPSGTIGAELVLKSYLTGDVEYGKTQVNYVSTFPYEDEVQYEMYVNEDFLHGFFISNPQTKLARAANDLSTTDTDLRDIFTITVDSTLGFPDKGIIFIENEAIEYKSKSMNQFFECKRGAIGVFTEHAKGETVWGPYYVEAKFTENGETYCSRSWPLGLVESVDIKDAGNLHELSDKVYIDGPGRIDPRDKILGSFIENFDDKLATQAVAAPEIKYIGNFTAGVSGQFFDDKYAFIASSNLPYETLGPFSASGNSGESTIGESLEGDNAIHIIPRRDSISNPNPFQDKGTASIGVFADGVSAWSNVSNVKVTQGKIAQIVVDSVGSNYITPTLLIDDVKVEDVTFAIGSTGDITEITSTSDTDYTGDKTDVTRISSGEDGEIQLTFDNYGRLINAMILDGGKYYHDTPTLEVVDPTGVGRGALLTCTVDATLGRITTVKIENPGIDYNKAGSYVNIIPRGEGAKASAVVQFYTFNRVVEIQNNQTNGFDPNNGYVFFDEANQRTQYAYAIPPQKVRESLGDDATKHSPILGWAYDGHPIYGPTIYRNSVDEAGGFMTAKSGYFLLPTRQNIIAGGGGIGTNPPSVDTFPMGSFIQDYVFDPLRVSSSELLATNNDGTDPNYTIPAGSLLETDPEDFNINAFLGNAGTDFTVCNKYNGVIGNTPEYPAELYPGGVFFYVATMEGENPKFPYIIGDNFYSRPISQNLRATDEISPTKEEHMSYTPGLSFEETEIEFDFNKLARWRQPYLESTKAGLKCSISAVTEGNLDSVVVVNGNPTTSEVGDYIYFDNTDTGGSGATANVSFVEGSNVTRGFGTVNGTTLISHRQEIDLDYFVRDESSGLMYKPQYVFVSDTLINTTSGSTAQVESYNYDTRKLIVQTDTQRLIQPGDVFYDNNHLVAIVRDDGMINFMGTLDVADVPPSSPNAGEFWINIANSVPNAAFSLGSEVIAAGTPIIWDGTQWVAKTTLNSVYDGTNLTEHQVSDFVQAYKAMLAYEDAKIIIEESGNYLLEMDNEVPAIVSGRPMYGSSLFITHDEPDSSVAKQGDMWWSINNGRLFVYYVFTTLDPTQNTYFTRGQWVSAQPFGTRTLAGATDVPVVTTPANTPDAVTHEMADNTITISTQAPSSRPDGTPNALGDLWWSNATGLLYIWNTNYVFQLEAGELIQSEWVVTDPSAMAPDQYASDETDPATIFSDGPNSFTDLADVSYTTSVTVIVAPTAPTTLENGNPLEVGTLWWSPVSGRMYIYYQDDDGFQWNVTNPIGTVPTEYALDKIIEGTGGDNISSVVQLPELATTRLLWFTNLKYFRVGDTIKFEIAAPGTDNSADTAVIQDILPGNGAIVNRDNTPTLLPNGSPVIDMTRSLYTIETLTPCNLIPGDIVKVNGVNAPDGPHEVLEIGDATSPIGLVTIEQDPLLPDYGQVLNLDLITEGSGYESDFYIYFYGGGGTGALALANTSPILSDGTGGNVIPPVKIINPGYNYTATPTPVYGTGLNTRQFRFFTDKIYPISSEVTYSTSAPQIQGKVDDVDLVSGGGGYSRLPTILGTYPKDIDRAITKITLVGQQIQSVDVLYGGSRYENPIAVFTDGANRGSGAAATVNVEDGIIQSITVTNPGNDYSDPYLTIVNAGGKYISTGRDIGKIRSIKVDDPGRNISPDRTIKPELQIDCRCVVNFSANTNATNFVVGEPVYQGIPSDKLFTAEVKAWKAETQELTLTFDPGTTGRDYGGVLLPDEDIIGEQSGAVALVLQEGQSDTPVVVNGVSGPDGVFINDKSMLNKKYAVIQDSNYFQLFSYVISSPLQRDDYEVIVRDTTHPTGFAMFADVIINDNVQSGSFVVNETPVTTG